MLWNNKETTIIVVWYSCHPPFPPPFRVISAAVKIRHSFISMKNRILLRKRWTFEKGKLTSANMVNLVKFVLFLFVWSTKVVEQIRRLGGGCLVKEYWRCSVYIYITALGVDRGRPGSKIKNFERKKSCVVFRGFFRVDVKIFLTMIKLFPH